MTEPPDTAAIALIDRLGGMLMLARVLVQAQRTVDLGMLEDNVGRLCAACLDLPPGQARALRPRLHGLVGELDALAAACRAAQKVLP